MFLLIYPVFALDPAHTWIPLFRVCLLIASFLMLILFGVRLISGANQTCTGLGYDAHSNCYLGIWIAGSAAQPYPSLLIG